MPRFSPDGRHVLNSDTLGTNAMDAWWLTPDTVITYRYDTEDGVERCGLYTRVFPDGAWMYVGNQQCAFRLSMQAVGTNEWIGEYSDRAPLPGVVDSHGTHWDSQSYGLTALGDLGERVMIRKPGFDALTISRNGVEQTIPAPNFTNYIGTMRQGHLMWPSTSGGRDINGQPVGPPGAMQVFNIGPDGQKWCTGYVADWGLSVWKWGSRRGFNLSTDAYDFYPDVFVDTPSRLRVASSMTQGDTRLRLYSLDVAVMKYLTPDGVTHDLVEVDLLLPPARPPDPPIIKPPDPPIIIKPPDPPIKPPVKPPIVPPIHPPDVPISTSAFFFLKGR